MPRPPAPPPPARQRRKDERPQELLQGALELFVDRGFSATRSEEVAQRAGVAKGTLYRYFYSKEELFKAVVREHLVARLADFAAAAANHQGPVQDLLRHMLHSWWASVGQGAAGGISKVMLVEARNFPELAQFYLDEVIEPTRTLIGRLVQQGIDRGEFRPVPIAPAVHVLLSPLLQMMLQEHSFGACGERPSTLGAPEMLDAQMSLLLGGLLAEPASKI